MCKLWFQKRTTFFPKFEGLVTPRGYIKVGFQHFKLFNIKEKIIFYDFIYIIASIFRFKCWNISVSKMETLVLKGLIIISPIFPENFIEIPQVVQKIWRFSPSILTIFTNFLDFLSFTKKLMSSAYNRWCRNFFSLKLLYIGFCTNLNMGCWNLLPPHPILLGTTVLN